MSKREFFSLTPKDMRGIITARQDFFNTQLQVQDTLVARQVFTALSIAGVKDLNFDKCRTFPVEAKQEEVVIYKDAETVEEEIEQRLLCDRLASVLRAQCKPQP